MDVGPEIQFTWQDAMAAPMACEERNFVSFEDPEHISFRRITEGCLQADFPRLRESGHVIEPATADDSNFRFRQKSPCEED